MSFGGELGHILLHHVLKAFQSLDLLRYVLLLSFVDESQFLLLVFQLFLSLNKFGYQCADLAVLG